MLELKNLKIGLYTSPVEIQCAEPGVVHILLTNIYHIYLYENFFYICAAFSTPTSDIFENLVFNKHPYLHFSTYLGNSHDILRINKLTCIQLCV